MFYDPNDEPGIVDKPDAKAQGPGNKVFVFDTTLRDGEQAAGSRLDPSEKLDIARQLVRLGVDVMEVGFPMSSPRDLESVSLVSRELEGPTICALSRAIPTDIEKCGQALECARDGRIHTGLGISDVHILGKFKDPRYGMNLKEKREHVLGMAVEAVERARDYVGDVEFYAEDAARADRGYLFDVITAVVEAGATVVNIPDTTGYAVPEQFGGLIRDLRGNVANIDRILLSVHCHNDLGLAVSNTLAGVRNGARQVEVTVNGIGERAGNASLEEVVMALKTRWKYFRLETAIDTKELYRTSQLVARAFGYQVPHNKPIVGSNAFAHSAGIHVDGFLKDRRTYEIIQPEDVGFPRSRIVLTARSGRHAVRHRLEELGYSLSPSQIDIVYQKFIEIADKVREVPDHALMAIVNGEARTSKIFDLESLKFSGGTNQPATASVTMKIRNRTVNGRATGDGPVDAAYKALSKAVGIPLALIDFSITTTGQGAEAVGEATVKVKNEGIAIGRGASTDIVLASARAYVDALNKMASQEMGEQIAGSRRGPASNKPGHHPSPRKHR